MTTTTFKSVGGTNKPAEQPAAPAKAAKDRSVAAPAKPKASKKHAAKPLTDEHKKAQVAAHKRAQKPAGDPDTVTIKGTGTIPVIADGAMRRLPKGKPVKVSAAELAFLKRSKVELA